MRNGGKLGFESHFSGLYKGRWDALYTALKKPAKELVLIPPFWAEIPPQNENEEEQSLESQLTKTRLPWCYSIDVNAASINGNGEDADANENAFRCNVFDANSRVVQLKDCAFHLDFSTAFAAFCLGVQPGDRVLDLEAQCGSKSLIFASCMFHDQYSRLHGIVNSAEKSTSELVQMIKDKTTQSSPGLLVVNNARQTSTFKKLLPERLFSTGVLQLVNYNCKDFAKFSRFGNFDKIFIHAIQSNESKLVQRNQLNKWTDANYKINANETLQVLNNFIRQVKVGGVLVYCTNCLHPYENELVVHAFLQQHVDVETLDITHLEFEACISKYASGLVKRDFSDIEVRRFGVALMPDKGDAGPCFICKFRLKS